MSKIKWNKKEGKLYSKPQNPYKKTRKPKRSAKPRRPLSKTYQKKAPIRPKLKLKYQKIKGWRNQKNHQKASMHDNSIKVDTIIIIIESKQKKENEIEKIKTNQVTEEIGELEGEESSDTLDQLERIFLGIICHQKSTEIF